MLALNLKETSYLKRKYERKFTLYDYQIADGMTVEIHTVNLLLETRGGAQGQGGATW